MGTGRQGEPYGFIYTIRNTVNNKVYVGQTVQGFDKRYNGDWARHTHNTHLKESVNKYGIQSFTVDKTFAVAYSKVQLDRLERELIWGFRSYKPKHGYNKGLGGNNQRPVVQLSKEGEFVDYHEIMRNAGFDPSHVSKCCQGKRFTHGGFRWVFAEDFDKMMEVCIQEPYS